MRHSVRIVNWLASLLILFAVSTTLHAQLTEGSIAGTVTDASGAAVAGGNVKITNLQTGAVDDTKTDNIGYYRVLHLQIGAYQIRVEAQGFASPVWVDASGNPIGTAFMLAEDANRTVTIALPEAQFGTPGPGWAFSVVLTGQDGFRPDQARAFAATPADFTFGVCAAGGASPICGVDPSTVPKAVDVITPPGVSQATELDPTAGPVVIQPVPVP